MSLFERAKFFARKFNQGFRPSDLVLDIGSGNDPHPRADLLCDKFVQDDTEREGRLVVDRPLLGGDLEALPLRDKSVDFAIASHVLEHVHDPVKALQELQRVARRGYIETPAEFGGKLMDLPGHRWYVRKEADGLVFTGKSQGMYDDHLNGVFFGMWKQDKGFMRFFWSHLDLFFVRHTWEGEVPVKVIAPPGELFDPETFFNADVEAPQLEKSGQRSLKTFVKDGIRGYYHSPLYGPARPFKLEELAGCPACHGALHFEAEQIACVACALQFPYLETPGRKIPLLLLEKATRPAPLPH